MFTLGNLTATNEATRRRLGRHPDALPTLAVLIQEHTKLLRANMSTLPGAAGGGSAEKLNKPAAEAADVLVKTCRTAAHLAIDGAIAQKMLTFGEIGIALTELLALFPPNLPPGLAELALNALSVLTNLAFHGSGDEIASGASCLEQNATAIARSLVHLMACAQPDVVVQAVRAGANLCRQTAPRDAMAASSAGGLVAAAIALLHHRRREAAITACGMLMNIVQTPAGKRALSFTCLVEVEDADAAAGGACESMSAAASLTRVVDAAYWGADLEFAIAASRVLFNHALGWRNDDPSDPSRLTDDEALGLLAVLDGASADAKARLDCRHRSSGKEAEADAGDSGADDVALGETADVLWRLRCEVQYMVQDGRVADHEERFRTSENSSAQESDGKQQSLKQ
jgi:hypothetical protein